MPEKPERPEPGRLEAKKLSHYVDVVEEIYHHRFMTAEQVFHRFSGIENPRTARHQLRLLYAHQHLDVLPVRAVSKNFPYVYFVTSRGISFVKRERQLEGKTFEGSREDTRASGKTYSTAMHEILTTEVQLKFERMIREDDGEVLFTERRYHVKGRTLSYPTTGAPKHFAPDIGLLFRIKGKLKPLTFVEFDNDSEGEGTLFKKLENYHRWWITDGKQYLINAYTQAGSLTPKPVFYLCFVLHRGLRLNPLSETIRAEELHKKAQSFDPLFRRFLWFTEAAGFAEDTCPLWLQASDTQGFRFPFPPL